MTWTEPPEPSHGVPDVEPGHIITRDHPAWHRRHDERVWGALASTGVHNPFHDGPHEPPANWGSGNSQRVWGRLREQEPDRFDAAEAGMRRALPGLRLAVAAPTHALHGIAETGHIGTVFTHEIHDDRADHGRDRYLHFRRSGEHTLFGYPHQGHPDSARPIYGYLSHDPFTDRSGFSYGHHTLVLSRPALSHRTTWNAGDSLDDDDRVRPSPWNEPHLRSVFSESNHLRKDEHDYGVHDLLANPGGKRLYYMEAQVHGGVGQHHISHAILRNPNAVLHAVPREEPMAPHVVDLAAHLTRAGIPWVFPGGFRHPGADHPHFRPRRGEAPR